jgi:hypothetical protein
MRTEPVLIMAYLDHMINPLLNDALAEERRRQLLESAARERLAGTSRDGRRRRLTTWVNRTFRSTVR